MGLGQGERSAANGVRGGAPRKFRVWGQVFAIFQQSEGLPAGKSRSFLESKMYVRAYKLLPHKTQINGAPKKRSPFVQSLGDFFYGA